MTKISDPYSGKRKFFKGKGRSGNKNLDEYQKTLIEQEEHNKLEEAGKLKQKRQKPLKGKELKEYQAKMKALKMQRYYGIQPKNEK